MEHSTAIMEDAGNAIEGGSRNDNKSNKSEGSRRGGQENNYNQRKRKGEFSNAGRKQGGRGRGRGRGGHDDDNKRHKKSDMGRGEYFASQPDKRQKTSDSREKREDGKGPQYGTQFSKEEIDAEERKPKRKVAVMIGYSGTGYKGMQISPSEKTIEGDLFNAFVAAGAISKANADDPKKASLVRCARTDKGVHAAGNMISLKLIVEDDDIVQKINEALSPQIRVWGIERTIGSFSCYQACDSRWYEYLLPSHAFLPPHPSSWLAKKLEDLADEAGDREGYESRQAEVMGFWERVDEEAIKPVLDTVDEDIRFDVIKALQGEDEANAKAAKAEADVEQTAKAGKSVGEVDDAPKIEDEKTEEAATIINAPAVPPKSEADKEDPKPHHESGKADDSSTAETVPPPPGSEGAQPEAKEESTAQPQLTPEEFDRQTRLRAATKRLRQAYITAKRQYRIPQQRIDRIQAALDKFVGTANYHNYTIQKTWRDPSAKRHIKSFVANRTPVLIGEGPEEEKSEWLSLKVHGQSFMMHQIRKMIGMITLLVRCGSDINTMHDSFGSEKYSIPKVPGLGLLLERPVFDSYNNLQAPKHGREKLEFGKYEKELEAFKQREIYQRIFREEEEKNEFGRFFNHIDNFKEAYFLYVTSKGLEATKGAVRLGGGGKVVESDEEQQGDGE
ncbi:tRNA pseudouridine synthase 1 [Vermiconidia calcicola]|uniref:tRNA pseudouridine synthase 1 n=1 Tax=Vermiconidia calcicola TaxID=1690605 RepID=A0ACC3MV16_9PEZI|nr:tRNA pseudouridine synthase 1 [Vermiconidia calcicola]